MRPEEAKYIGDQVRVLLTEDTDTLINIGSSTDNFRRVDQPYIHREIFEQIDNSGKSVVHVDLKDNDGVDLVGNIFDKEMQTTIKSYKPKVLLVCNLMEHLEVHVRDALPQVLDNVIEPGGHLIITVPYSYPLHFDPIDTYYRPSPEELCLLFPSYKIIDSRVVVSGTFLPEFIKYNWKTKLKIFVRILTPFYRPMKWLGMMQRFTFLFRPYKISCVVLQKESV